MYFAARSSCPQFSMITSIGPVPNPCHDTCSSRFFCTTSQLNLSCNTRVSTAPSAVYPTHAFIAKFTVPHGFALEAPGLPEPLPPLPIFCPPHPLSASPAATPRASPPNQRFEMSNTREFLSRGGLPQPGLPWALVGVEPPLGGVVARKFVNGEVAGDLILVVVAPGEVLDQIGRRAAGLGELAVADLVQVVRLVVAGDRLRVGVAAGGV